MPNKSRVLGALIIPDKYFFDFLRGSFDGDGSFYSYFDPRWKSSFMYYVSITSASSPHINWLRETLHRLLGVDGHISKMGENRTDRNPIFNLRFAKKRIIDSHECNVLNNLFGIPFTKKIENRARIAYSG